jgi:hypothetical protein
MALLSILPPIAFATGGSPRNACHGAGTLRATACIFKFGQRSRLLPYAARAWAHLSVLRASPGMAGNVLARMLAVKVVQRIGLTFLAPRLAPWRYVRGSAVLDTALTSGGGGLVSCVSNRQ